MNRTTLGRYLGAVALSTLSTGITRPLFPLFAASLGVGVVLIGILDTVGIAANASVRRVCRPPPASSRVSAVGSGSGTRWSRPDRPHRSARSVDAVDRTYSSIGAVMSFLSLYTPSGHRPAVTVGAMRSE